jgi:hypothetical protein
MGVIGSSTLQASGFVTRRTFNSVIAAANIEQSLVLPTSVSGYLVRVREGAELKLTHVATESGTKYMTIPKRATHTDEHSYTGATLYFQSPTAGVTVEVVAWEV